MAYWHAVPTISITVILMDTITPDQCRFPDTAKLFEPLTRNKVLVTRWETPDQLRTKMTELARQLGYLEGGRHNTEKSIITV
jgi:phosphoribosylaminoimidazole-succinocarboxamide synthase